MKKLLIHVCCAPCVTILLEKFNDYEITLHFYNPNIMPKDEYMKRLEEVKKLAKIYSLVLIEEKCDNNNYLKLIKGFEKQAEKGYRCFICYQMRLQKTSEIATNYDFWTTSLFTSPYKDKQKIAEIGNDLCKKFIALDFVQSDYKRSIELAKQYDLYRQKYCGCKFN